LGGKGENDLGLMFVGTSGAIDLMAAMTPSGLASAVRFKAGAISRGEIVPARFECTGAEITRQVLMACELFSLRRFICGRHKRRMQVTNRNGDGVAHATVVESLASKFPKIRRPTARAVRSRHDPHNHYAGAWCGMEIKVSVRDTDDGPWLGRRRARAVRSTYQQKSRNGDPGKLGFQGHLGSPTAGAEFGRADS
jgi:hypothetical protein